MWSAPWKEYYRSAPQLVIRMAGTEAEVFLAVTTFDALSERHTFAVQAVVVVVVVVDGEDIHAVLPAQYTGAAALRRDASAAS